MKRITMLFTLTVCCLLTACKKEQVPAYVKAYTDFLLSTNFVESENADFPVRGFSLVDLNFDRVPELLVFHDSCGSMGGYFTFYYFDGTRINAVLNNNNVPAICSAYAQILADTANSRVYLLKEMYLLRGNENGTYGYIREIVNENGVPYIYDILDLNVNQEMNLENYDSKNYHNENDFLMDDDLAPCLITQFYDGLEWINITSSEYLQKKKNLLSEENEYKDLLDTNAEYLWSQDEVVVNEQYVNRKITKEEIDILFSAWLHSLE